VNLKTTPLHREVVESLSWREIADIKLAMKNIPPQKAGPKPAAAAVLKSKPREIGPMTQNQARAFEQQMTQRKKERKQKLPRDNTAPDRQAQAKFDRDLSKEMTRPPLPYTRPGPKKKGKTPKGEGKKEMTRQGAKHCKLTQRLQQYVDSLANPWAGTGSRNPINYNPVPTMMTSCATTTNTLTDLAVATGTTTEITLFAGHGVQSQVYAMDGTAYHAQQQGMGTGGTTPYTIGPVPVYDSITTQTLQPTNGVITSGLTLGNYAPSSTSIFSLPLNNTIGGGYDQALPYTGVAGQMGHTRWKLVSMGFRIICTTPLVYRGGDIAYVQPSQSDNPYYDTSVNQTQVQFADYPSYTITQAENLGELKISWIPKPEDCAFWHTTSTGGTPADSINGYLSDVAIRIWINNPTTYQQIYSFQVVMNWEMGGQNLVTLSSPKALQPADKNIVEPLLEVMRFSSKSATTAPSIAKALVDTITPIATEVAVSGISQLGKLAGAALLALI